MSLDTFKQKVLPVKDKLYRFALGYLKDTDKAQDLVQDVLIKVWDKQEKLNELDNVEAWCMRITRNLAIDRLKSKKEKYTDYMSEEFDVSENESYTPYHTTENQDTMNTVGQFIASLPDKQQHVITLRDVEGYSYKEICDIMAIDMNQVKVNLFRARKTLKENLMNINAYGLK